MPELRPPGPAEVAAASERIAGIARRTPLVRWPGAPGDPEVWLKLETLQPVGSFKIRGAASAVRRLPPERLAAGVVTASAGNMAQGVAWCARELGVPCAVVVPDSAPRAKLDAVAALGARVVPVPFERWWRVMVEHRFEGEPGHFIHPVADADVIAGNATIGLEILEDLPAVGDVFVPFGGGGLSCGIAAALRHAGSAARVLACEVETAAPLAASLRAGRAVAIERRPSFVDGIGGSAVLEPMWPLASTLLAGACVVTLEEIAAAIRALAGGVRVVAEGAGAAALAAARSGRAACGAGGRPVARGERFEGRAGRFGEGPAVCVVSGGVIEPRVLATLLAGGMP